MFFTQELGRPLMQLKIQNSSLAMVKAVGSHKASLKAIQRKALCLKFKFTILTFKYPLKSINGRGPLMPFSLSLKRMIRNERWFWHSRQSSQSSQFNLFLDWQTPNCMCTLSTLVQSAFRRNEPLRKKSC